MCIYIYRKQTLNQIKCVGSVVFTYLDTEREREYLLKSEREEISLKYYYGIFCCCFLGV